MSSEKTINLGMHRWLPNDGVRRDEWNENFEILDKKMDIISNKKVRVEDFEKMVPEANDSGRVIRAINSLGAAGGVLEYAVKNYELTAPLTKYSNIKHKGAGRGATVFNYTNGSEFLFTLSDIANVQVEDIKIDGKAVGKGIRFSNVFKNSLDNCWIHDCKIGVEFNDNAGDNVILNTLFTDNDVAISAQSQINYIGIGCVFSGNNLCFEIGQPNKNTYAALRAMGVTCVTNAAKPFPTYAIKQWNGTAHTTITGCWFEGFLNTIDVGEQAWAANTTYKIGQCVYANNRLYRCTVAGGMAGTIAPSHSMGTAVDGTITWEYISDYNAGNISGVYGFTVRDTRIAGTAKCLTFNQGRGYRVDNVTLSADNTTNQGSYTGFIPDEITIGAEAESGRISNLISLITGRSFNPLIIGLKAGWEVSGNRFNPAFFGNGVDLGGKDIANIGKINGIIIDTLQNISNVGSLRMRTNASFLLGSGTVDEEGEVAYDRTNKAVVFRKDSYTARLQEIVAPTDQDMNNHALLRIQHAGFQVRGAAPSSPFIGMVAYANGTTWNPGNGEGVYTYKSTGWSFLG